MNICNFCIFPKGSSFIPDFQSARHLWLPLERVRNCPIEIENPCIVFNISGEEVKRQNHQKFFFDINDERWKDPSLHLPVEAISHAYAFADKAIEWAKEHDERYREHYDRFLEALLKPNKTGYSRWILRCLLYGGLLKAYRAAMEK